MAETTPAPAPPVEVLLEFLRRLSETVTEYDAALVLRGSLLLKCWFGPEARPAGDIDLECFETPVSRGDSRFSRNPVVHGRALCLYATEEWRPPEQDRGGPPDIEFEPIDPEDGTDLWDYGTPGERCYTLWVAHSLDDARGSLQIDLAQAGSYELSDIGVEAMELGAAGTTPFRFRCYTPEMLLAAKLSWLMRGLKRPVGPDSAVPPQWTGQPKDLFDAHLLLTKTNLRTNEIENGLYAVGVEDKLDWLDLDYFLDAGTRMSDDDFGNWEGFRRQNEALIDSGPAEMMRTVANRLRTLLSEFREHVPFLRAINAAPADELEYAIYADWLESRGDQRGHLLRHYIKCAFRPDKPTLRAQARGLLTNVVVPEELSRSRQDFIAAIRTTPAPWLYQVFGSPERFRQIRREIEVVREISKG
jgi:uncharacterized protein (TIGR02996 family)